ncbi:GMC oxidoreductase [Modestobacter sp. SSW1-42]|uniref:GMC oxidoreductase n=1 Tax=Modestobacter sp. SSW1-42 TaxID=596372 RepID=UPI003985A875
MMGSTSPRTTQPRWVAAERLPRDDYQALVIGTGFGGAVAACRLAQAGVDVAVVERGRRWPLGSFPRDATKLDDGWLWACGHGLYDATARGDILAIRAAGYGGGSLVYANVAARPPAEVFADWPAPLSREHLEPYFDLAAHMLGVSPTPADPRTGAPPPKTRLMQEAARRVDRVDGFFHPNLAVTFADDPQRPKPPRQAGLQQAPCTFCGECDIGCNVGAKNTLDRNYLAVAEAAGAAVGTRTEAVWIRREDATGPAGEPGYRVRLREHGHDSAGKEGVEREVTARHVFVCAGALGSTELLLRSRDQYRTLPDLPPSLGEGYSGNGDFLSFGFDLPDAAEPVAGPTITTASVVHADTSAGGRWFVIEDGGFSPHIARLVAGLDLAGLPARVARAMRRRDRRTIADTRALAAALPDRLAERTSRTAVLLAMGRDAADGRIALRGRARRLHVTWDTTRNDPLYDAEAAASAEIVRALGGRPAVTPTWRLFRQPVTVHNLGGCRMGGGPADGVVDTDGQVFGHPGLYVVDGAVLPGSTGGNPSMTIAAVAEHCLQAAVRRITGDSSWEPPERLDVVRREIPEDAAVARIRLRGPTPPSRPGVVFRETMRGSVDGRAVVLRLTARIEDLQRFLADPIHTVALTGTVDVAGLTRRPASVQDGVLHLLAPAEPPGHGARTMAYALRFDDDTGRMWVLRGVKDVRRRPGTGPWRATTVLTTTLEAEGQGAGPEGRLTITASAALRLLVSLRATGLPRAPAPVTGARAVGTLLRFGSFFATAVAEAFLPRTSRRRRRMSRSLGGEVTARRGALARPGSRRDGRRRPSGRRRW